MSTTAIISVVSLLTSLTSLIGFFSTTILAHRKDRRETQAAQLAIEKSQLEVEKLRRELGKSKEEPNSDS